jgi:hypothetical protein
MPTLSAAVGLLGKVCNSPWYLGACRQIRQQSFGRRHLFVHERTIIVDVNAAEANDMTRAA